MEMERGRGVVGWELRERGGKGIIRGKVGMGCGPICCIIWMDEYGPTG